MPSLTDIAATHGALLNELEILGGSVYRRASSGDRKVAILGW